MSETNVANETVLSSEIEAIIERSSERHKRILNEDNATMPAPLLTKRRANGAPASQYCICDKLVRSPAV